MGVFVIRNCIPLSRFRLHPERLDGLTRKFDRTSWLNGTARRDRTAGRPVFVIARCGPRRSGLQWNDRRSSGRRAGGGCRLWRLWPVSYHGLSLFSCSLAYYFFFLACLLWLIPPAGPFLAHRCKHVCVLLTPFVPTRSGTRKSGAQTRGPIDIPHRKIGFSAQEMFS